MQASTLSSSHRIDQSMCPFGHQLPKRARKARLAGQRRRWVACDDISAVGGVMAPVAVLRVQCLGLVSWPGSACGG
jgi:hypothetical protein